jgi:flagellar protein FlaJ
MLRKIATRLFGDMLKPYLDFFEGLRLSMRSANLAIPVEEYVSLMLLFSFVAFAASLVLGAFFITLLVTTLSGAEALIYSYTLCIIVALASSAATFISGYYYPFFRAKNLGNRIDKSLPFAVFFMATSASSKVTPLEIFRMLSTKSGAIGEEAKRVYNDVKTLGMNLPDALQKLAARTPSATFSDLIWGMISTMTTGGDMEQYLDGKTRTFMSQYRRQLEEYSKQVALYTEVYITAIIVGTLFFIVLISIMSPLMGFSSLMIQTFLVFFIVPAVSLGFILLLKSISPTG